VTDLHEFEARLRHDIGRAAQAVTPPPGALERAIDTARARGDMSRASRWPVRRWILPLPAAATVLIVVSAVLLLVHTTQHVAPVGPGVSPIPSATTAPTSPSTAPTTPSTAPTTPSTASTTPTTPSTSSSRGSSVASARCLTATQAFAFVIRQRGTGFALDTVHGYLCVGGWAYVNFHDLSSRNHSTIDLRYMNGTWTIGDRVLACGDGTHAPVVPPAIYEYGCGN
jgi:hypothetical protein